jgi:AcrR family transcriptional regulator
VPKVVDHEARRLDFIEAAYATIIEEGLANTTIRAVARKAGYTTGALVHYFGDKDELIRLTLLHFGKEVRTRMVSAEEAGRGRAALRAVLVEALPTDRRKASSWRVWMALWYHSEQSTPMRNEERRRYREWIGRITRLLQEAIDDGELTSSVDIDIEARSLVGLLDGLAVQYLMSSGRIGAGKLIQVVDNHLDRLFRSP